LVAMSSSPWHESGGRSTRSQAGHVADESLLRNSPSCLDPSWESPCDGTIPPTAAPFSARFRVRRCKPPPLMRARIHVRSRTTASSVAHTLVLAVEPRCAHVGSFRSHATTRRFGLYFAPYHPAEALILLNYALNLHRCLKRQ